MHLDIPVLVAPLSDAAPSGPDLSYDDERIEIESAFERSISVDGASGEEADWRKIISQITAQAGRTRDLWLPVYLMRAAAFSKQFDLLVEATGLLAALLEERWADIHPQLDEYGFIGRKTPCESLTRIGDFLAPLSRVPLLDHPRFGQFAGEDFERFAAKGPAADGFGQFRATVDATSAEDRQALIDRFDALRSAFKRVDTVLTLNAEGDTATNFRPTYELLDRIRAALGKAMPRPEISIDAEASGDAGSREIDPGAPSGLSKRRSAQFESPAARLVSHWDIRNREDVVRALDAICAYYAAYEPGSPVPLVLRRAREWTELDFLAVLEEIAPGSMEEAGRVLRSSRSAPGGTAWAVADDGATEGAGDEAGEAGEAGGNWREEESASASSSW